MDENTTPSPNLLDLQWAVAQVREAIGYLRSSLDNLERAMVRLGDQEMEFPSSQATAAIAEAEAVWQISASVVEKAGGATEEAWSVKPAAAGETQTREGPSGEPTGQGLHDAAPPAWAQAEEARMAETTPAGPDRGAPEPWETAATPAPAGFSNSGNEHEAPVADKPTRRTQYEWAAESEERKSTWGQWSVPPSLREGGWPHGPEREPVGRQPSDLGAEEAAVDSEAPEGAEEDEVREQVRRAVEQLRVELGSSAGAPVEERPEAFLGPESGDVIPAPHGASLEQEQSSAEPSEEVREQVRRAVLAARAELESGRQGLGQGDTVERGRTPPVMNRPVAAEGLDERYLQPASFVIDDPEGRVELVRVYRTLALLNCAATANLANYSSHSVTVQLDQRELPTDEAIREAIRQAFERECTVEVIANRATIRLAGSKMRAA